MIVGAPESRTLKRKKMSERLQEVGRGGAGAVKWVRTKKEERDRSSGLSFGF